MTLQRFDRDKQEAAMRRCIDTELAVPSKSQQERIAELERQVLGLRSALKSVAAYPGTRKYLGNLVYDQALSALTDTERAGREAEARIVDSMVDKFGGPTEEGVMVCNCRILLDHATRLRNGGSDGE